MPVARVRMPDGRIARFDVPEGMTPDEVETYAQSFEEPGQDAKPAQDAPANNQPSAQDVLESFEKKNSENYNPDQPTSSYLFNSAKRGLAAIPAIIPAIPELTANAADYLGSKIVPGSTPYKFSMPMTAKTIELGENALGVDRGMKAPSPGTEIIGKGLEFFAAGSPLTGLGIKTAIKQAAKRGDRAAPAALSPVARDFETSLYMGAGSQLGGDIAQQFGQSEEAGSFLGALGGGAAGLATGGLRSSIYGGVKRVVGGKADRDLSQTKASKEIKTALDEHPGSYQNMDEANSIAERIKILGGDRPSFNLAQRSDAPDIKSLAKADTRKQYGAAVESQEQVSGAITSARTAAFKGSSEPLAADSIMFKGNRVLDDKLKANLKQQEFLVGSLKSSPQQAVGQRLDKLRDDAYSIAKARKDNLYEEVYTIADKVGVKESMEDAAALVSSIAKQDQNIFQNMPVAFSKVLRRAEEKSPAGSVLDEAGATIQKPAEIPASFQELHSLMRETSSELSAAVNSGQFTRAHYLGQLDKLLKSKVDKYLGTEYGPVAEKLTEANDFYRNLFVPAFREGVGGKIGSTVRFGERVPRSDITEKFLTPEGIDEFNLMFQGNKQAYSDLEDGIIGLFRSSAVKEGTLAVNPTSSKTFLTRHSEALDKLPEIKSKLTDVTSQQEALLASNASLLKKQRDLNNSYAAKVARSDNIESVVDNALQSPQKLNQLIGMRSKTDSSAIIKVIFDRIAVKHGVGTYDYLLQNQKTLKPLFDRVGKAHFNNALTISRAEQIAARTRVGEPPPATSAREDILKDKTGVSFGEVIAAKKNIERGRTSFGQESITLLGRMLARLKGDQSAKLMHEAIYDEKLAQQLLNYAKTGKESPELRGSLISIGLRPSLIGISDYDERNKDAR